MQKWCKLHVIAETASRIKVKENVGEIWFMSHSTKVKEFKLFFCNNNKTNLDFVNSNFNSEQLTAIIHSS